MDLQVVSESCAQGNNGPQSILLYPAFRRRPIWAGQICRQYLHLHVAFSVHFLLMQVLHENCKSLSCLKSQLESGLAALSL